MSNSLDRQMDETDETSVESRTCPRCGTVVPLQKTGAAVGIRPCPKCGRPISVRSKRGSDVFVDGGVGDYATPIELQPVFAHDTRVDGVETLPWPPGQSRGVDETADQQPAAARSKPLGGWRGIFALLAVFVVMFGALMIAGTFFDVPVDYNLTRVGRAVQKYIEQNNGDLPHSSTGPKGEKGLSWRVHLLPYFDDPKLEALYREFHLDEPWDSQHNMQLVQRMPAIYQTPDVFRQGMTALHVFTGRETPLGGGGPIKLKACLDGAANTILAVYAGKEMAEEWSSPGGVLLTPDPLTNLGTAWHGSFPVVMLDGAVRRIPYEVDPEFARALIVHDDMLEINLKDLENPPVEIKLPPGVKPPPSGLRVSPNRFKATPIPSPVIIKQKRQGISP